MIQSSNRADFDIERGNRMYARNRFRTYASIVACIVFAPLAANAGSIEITTSSGTTCYVQNDSQLATPASGPCSFGNAISSGGSASSSFNFDITLADGDPYNISGNYLATYTTAGGSYLLVNPTVTYLGSSATTMTDSITLDWLQSIYDNSCCTWAGNYTETVPLTATSGGGVDTTLSGQLGFDEADDGACPTDGSSNCLPALSADLDQLPTTLSASANLDFGDDNTSDYLYADYQFVFNIGEGTEPETEVSGATPEPPPAVLFASGLLLFAVGVLGRRRFRTNS